jgi:hypothetical protein
LLRLLYPIDCFVFKRFTDLSALVTYDYNRLYARKLQSEFEHMPEHRFAADRVQHFCGARAHSLTLACRQDSSYNVHANDLL